MRVHDTEDHAVLQELRGPVEAVIAPLPAVQVVTQTVAEIILAQLMGLTVERKLPILYPSLRYTGTLILMLQNPKHCTTPSTSIHPPIGEPAGGSPEERVSCAIISGRGVEPQYNVSTRQILLCPGVNHTVDGGSEGEEMYLVRTLQSYTLPRDGPRFVDSSNYHIYLELLGDQFDQFDIVMPVNTFHASTHVSQY